MHREQNKSQQYHAQVRFLFHATVKIKIPVAYSILLLDDLFSIMESVDYQYNSYRKDSYFDLINRSAGSFVEVDDVTIFLLKKIKEVASFFDGLYDISIMPLLRLWGFYQSGENRRLPSEEELQAALQKIDFRKIELEGNKVRIQKGQELTTGSFLKAFAVDRVVKELKRAGVSDALINAGGSTIRYLNDESHPFWDIRVYDPDVREQLLFGLKLSNGCFSTSAQKETRIVIDGKEYGHILNPKTGFPAANKQVGIVGKNAFEGDMLSTALMNVPSEQWKPLLKQLDERWGVSGFVIDENRKITFSDNFNENMTTE